jgi:hypothetical protein
MPIAHAPRSHIFKVATFSVFVLFVFNGFMVALAFAPVVVPITLFESLRSGYFVLVGFVAALAVSIALGLPFGLVFPRSTMNWSLLCSVLVAGIILFLSAFWHVRAIFGYFVGAILRRQSICPNVYVNSLWSSQSASRVWHLTRRSRPDACLHAPLSSDVSSHGTRRDRSIFLLDTLHSAISVGGLMGAGHS